MLDTERARVAGAQFALWFAVVLWAGSFPATRIALASFSPEGLMAVRFTLAGIVLAAWGVWKRVGWPPRQDWLLLTLVGLISGVAYQSAFNHGMQSVGSGPAAAVVDTAPIFTALLGTLFLREHTSVLGWIGILLGFAGVVLIAMEGGGEFRLEPGVLMLLAAAVLFAVNAVMQKPLLKRHGVNAISTWLMVGGSLPMLLFWPQALEAIPHARPEAWWAIAFLAFFPAALGFILWTYALDVLPVTQVASSLYLLPPLAFLIGWALLGEVPTMMAVAGTLLALAGVALVQLPPLLRGKR